MIGTSVGIAVGPGRRRRPRPADHATPTWRSTAPRATGAAPTASSSRRWTRRCRRAAPWSTTCARRCRPASSSCTTSRSSISRRNEISGFEALIRWHHPEKGMIPPGDVHPAGRGDRPHRAARRMGASGRPAPRPRNWPGDLKIAVNLSPAQFRSPGLVQVVVGALAASGLAPERLELEITESILLQDSEATLATLYPAARARRAHRHGRLRHGLFLAQLPAELPLRQDQDRPLVREGHRRRRGLAQHRARGGGAGQRASA